MKLSLLTMLVLASFAGFVSAQSPQPQVSFDAAPAPDWSGFYGGIIAGSDNGIISTNPASHRPMVGYLNGGFAGFNFQHGNLVFGGEAAHQRGNVHIFVTGRHLTWLRIDKVTDLKARVGYQSGNVLVYGFAGASFARYKDRDIPFRWVSTTGTNYGAGVEYRINDQFFVGVEYVERYVSGINNIRTVHNFDLNSLQFRLGIQF